MSNFCNINPFTWGLGGDGIYFNTLQKQLNAKYKEVPECTDELKEDVVFHNGNVPTGTTNMGQVTDMDDSADKDIAML